MSDLPPAASAGHGKSRLPANVPLLGLVSLLTATSSAMIYGLLPVFLTRVLGVSMASVGLIEGMAEAANSLVKIVSGTASDWLGRRKPFVVLGYALSAVVKTLFPQADAVSTVLTARVLDRIGKGIRDAPRDAFLADLITPNVRGAGFGLRLALAITGFVLGPLLAVALMQWSGGDFRLVFWIALIPAYLSVALLVVAVTELPANHDTPVQRLPFQLRHLTLLPAAFWGAMIVATLLSLARFSPAFLVLKAHHTGIGAAFVPMVLGVMYLVYSLAAYPFGVLSDRSDRRIQLGIGTLVLIAADVVLATTSSIWLAALGTALWGLQMGATQGVLGAIIADIAPDHLRGTAYGIYDLALGVAAFMASAAAGALWMSGGEALAFGASACVGGAAAVAVWLMPLPKNAGRSDDKA